MLKKYKLVEITSKKKMSYDSTTHDLTVSGDHSYVANGFVVHNSMCSTRMVTGVGKPQFSAVYDIQAVNHFDKLIISDGGIREFGDIAKAFGVGADMVMIGSLFAGFKDNTPGWTKDDTHVPVYGMASKTAHGKYYPRLKATPEGITEMVPVRESLEEFIEDLIGGLKSSLTYTGHANLSDFIGNVNFYQVNRTHHRK